MKIRGIIFVTLHGLAILAFSASAALAHEPTSGGKSEATAVAGARATASGRQRTQVDASTVDQSSVSYAAERPAANTAASVVEGYCSGAGMSVQVRGVGISGTSKDLLCARLAIAAALEGHAAHLREAEQDEKLAQSVELEARLQLTAAIRALDGLEGRGGLRRRVFGWMPWPLVRMGDD